MSVRPSVKSNISAKMEQNSAKNMKPYYLKDNSETSTRADRQNASDVRLVTNIFFSESPSLSKIILGMGVVLQLSRSWIQALSNMPRFGHGAVLQMRGLPDA